MTFSRIKIRFVIAAEILLLWLSGCNQPSNSNSQNKFERHIKIQEIAKQTTVRIIGRVSGTGVLIASQGDQYYILTSKHIVDTPPGEIEDQYQIQTPDGKLYKIQYEKVRKDPKFDLAIVEFTSNEGKKYSVTKLTKSLSKGENVYVSGWKDCTNPKYEFRDGQISQVISDIPDKSRNKQQQYTLEDFKEGYRVQYTNETITGMSGSPVFDDGGRVVAIHGKSGRDKENQYDFEKCQLLPKSFGNNWGISIETFLNSSLASGIPLQQDNNFLQTKSSIEKINEKL